MGFFVFLYCLLKVSDVKDPNGCNPSLNWFYSNYFWLRLSSSRIWNFGTGLQNWDWELVSFFFYEVESRFPMKLNGWNVNLLPNIKHPHVCCLWYWQECVFQHTTTYVKGGTFLLCAWCDTYTLLLWDAPCSNVPTPRKEYKLKDWIQKTSLNVFTNIRLTNDSNTLVKEKN